MTNISSSVAFLFAFVLPFLFLFVLLSFSFMLLHEWGAAFGAGPGALGLAQYPRLAWLLLDACSSPACAALVGSLVLADAVQQLLARLLGMLKPHVTTRGHVVPDPTKHCVIVRVCMQ